MKKALLALDIDGTLTDDAHKIPDPVIEYLKKSHDDGCVIALVTGRFYPFAKNTIKELPFPYFLGAQNGAQLFSMPDQKNIKNFLLDKALVLEIDEISKSFEEDFIVYSDETASYQTFYRKNRFDPLTLHHIFKMASSVYHPFTELSDFAHLPTDYFTCVKHFGTFDQLQAIHNAIKMLPIHQTLIQDPTRQTHCMNLSTHPLATKGKTVDNILELLGLSLPVIGAGNDRNDIELLKRADEGIAVGSAPKELVEVSTLQAPSSGEGLISLLDLAKQRLGL